MFKVGYGDEDTVLEDILNGSRDEGEEEVEEFNGIEELEFDTDDEYYMSPEQEKEIRKNIVRTYVRSSHASNYFKSKEEEESDAELTKEFLKLQKYKYKTRKIDVFIDATRQCFKCLDMVARGTESGQLLFGGVDQFKAAWINGEVKITGLWRPKYIGKDAKTLNWNYLWDYILDPEKPSNEFKRESSKGDDIFTKSPDEIIADYNAKYGDDFYDRFWVDTPENRKRQELHDSGLVYDREYLDDMEQFIADGNLEIDGIRWLCKLDPSLKQDIRDITKAQDRSEALSRQMDDSFVSDAFGSVGYFDKEYDVEFDDNYEPPVFKGDLFNKKDYDRYMKECDEWEAEHIKVNFRGTMMTKEEADYKYLLECMEKNGINTKLIKIIEDPNEVPKEIKKRRKAVEKNDQIQKSLKSRIKKMKKMEKAFKKGKVDQKFINDKLKSLENQTDYMKELKSGKKKKKKKVKKELKKAKKETGFDLLEYPEMEKYTTKAKKKVTKHLSKEDAKVYEKTMDERKRFISDHANALTNMMNESLFGEYKNEKEWSENIGKWDYEETKKKETE